MFCSNRTFLFIPVLKLIIQIKTPYSFAKSFLMFCGVILACLSKQVANENKLQRMHKFNLYKKGKMHKDSILNF